MAAMGTGPASVFAWMLINFAGAKAGPIKIASLNIGGDGPQPEFLGGEWDVKYSDVEAKLGATLICLHRNKKKLLDEKKDEFVRYTDHMEVCIEGLGETPIMQYVTSSMPEAMQPKINTETATTAMGEVKTMKQFAAYLWEGDFSKLDQGDCKQRTVFPYFGEGFIVMYKMLYRAGANSSSNDPYAVYEKSRHEKCKKRKITQYMPLFLFDMIILKLFHEQVEGNDAVPMAMKYLEGGSLIDRKKEIVNTIRDTVDILFLQEASDYFTETKRVKQTVIGEMEVVKDAEDGVDAAIILKGKTMIFQKKEELYGNWKQFVMTKTGALEKTMMDSPAEKKIEGMPGAGTLSTYLPGGNDFQLKWDKDKETEEWTNPAEQIFDVEKTAVGIAQFGGKQAMLMSMHPKSNGRPCVIFAAMALQFFKEECHENLAFLLVGMDANVLVKADYDSKKTKQMERGFDWNEFKGAAVTMGFKVIFDDDGGGGKVPVPTVHKTRSFLQTQLKKAGKVDITTKDIMLLYNRDSVSPVLSITVKTMKNKTTDRRKVVDRTEVVNWAPKDNGEMDSPPEKREKNSSQVILEGFSYIKGVAFPQENWPLDHFMTVAIAHLTNDDTPSVVKTRSTKGQRILVRVVKKVLRTLLHRGLAKS